jgi:hypothetical protein
LIPNNADAYDLGLTTGERFQAMPDATDFDILAASVSLAGAVSTGCAVTAQATPDNTVAVAAGVVIVNGVNVAVAAGNVTMTAAPSSGNNRRDIVVVNSSGTKSWVAGTAVADGTVPVKPGDPGELGGARRGARLREGRRCLEVRGPHVTRRTFLVVAVGTAAGALTGAGRGRGGKNKPPTTTSTATTVRGWGTYGGYLNGYGG